MNQCYWQVQTQKTSILDNWIHRNQPQKSKSFNLYAPSQPRFRTKQKLTKPTKVKLKILTKQVRPTWIHSRSARNLTSKAKILNHNTTQNKTQSLIFKKKSNFVRDQAQSTYIYLEKKKKNPQQKGTKDSQLCLLCRST